MRPTDLVEQNQNTSAILTPSALGAWDGHEFEEGQRVRFSGDAVLNGGVARFGGWVGIVDPVAESCGDLHF